jgi:hypothetical protein
MKLLGRREVLHLRFPHPSEEAMSRQGRYSRPITSEGHPSITERSSGPPASHVLWVLRQDNYGNCRVEAEDGCARASGVDATLPCRRDPSIHVWRVPKDRRGIAPADKTAMPQSRMPWRAARVGCANQQALGQIRSRMGQPDNRENRERRHEVRPQHH